MAIKSAKPIFDGFRELEALTSWTKPQGRSKGKVVVRVQQALLIDFPTRIRTFPHTQKHTHTHTRRGSEKFTIIFEHSMAAAKNAKNDWKIWGQGLEHAETDKGSRGYSPGFRSTTETRQKAMTKRKIRENRFWGGWVKSFAQHSVCWHILKSSFPKCTHIHTWSRLGVQSSTHDCENGIAKVGKKKKVATKQKRSKIPPFIWVFFFLTFLSTFSSAAEMFLSLLFCIISGFLPFFFLVGLLSFSMTAAFCPLCADQSHPPSIQMCA